MSHDIEPGKTAPLGASISADGVNFSVFSKSATSMELLLFDSVDDGEPSRVIPLSPKDHRTFHYWHAFVHGLRPGQLYGYRAHGPHEPEHGLRFDGEKLLLDPYGRGVAVGENYSRTAASAPGSNLGTAMKSVVADRRAYDWEGDTPLNHPISRTVIYELHVGGFTKHPSSGINPEKRGTYAGLIEKIPYLTELGINAVELLPVFQFDQQDCPEGLSNYWGYSPVSFFAPHCGYSSRKDPLGPLHEFRDMIKALHRAGIEVILDVVYNHTAEGDTEGPTQCFKGLENSVYYILEQDPSEYTNFSGTGNTVNASHSVVRRMIIESLRYWVAEMHVDGFRFDLAPILSRDESGHPQSNPPTLWAIESDPVLAGTKLIAEAWDAAGLYQVGSFIGDKWKEWNGRFRDDVRAFVKGDPDTASGLASRILASPDLYGHQAREPQQSINFVTCHDGFTLNDLVSYDHKHNEANLEGNRDGSDHNLSWNCGVEGPTNDPDIERVRQRQIKNFFTITLISLGTPMLLMGDEVRRTQHGNNNVYCQDNELSWFDWALLERHGDMLDFVRQLIRLRLRLDMLQEDHGMSLIQLLEEAQIQWHGIELHQPDWGENARSLAFTAQSLDGKQLFHVMLNAYWEALEFALPPRPADPAFGWRRLIDTYREPPEDFWQPLRAPLVEDSRYVVGSRTVLLLIARMAPDEKRETEGESA